MSSSRFKVKVTKDYLVFCSGHFITYEGDRCERLHGHNYRTAVEVEGDLDENHYVIDFIALKDMTRAITDELDHRMLLPTRNPLIGLHEEGANLRVTYGDRMWSFPRDECVLLPIANTHGRVAGGSHCRPVAAGDGCPRLEGSPRLAGRGRGELRSVGRGRVARRLILRGMKVHAIDRSLPAMTRSSGASAQAPSARFARHEAPSRPGRPLRRPFARR